MNGVVLRTDVFYEVALARPAFGHIGSFSQILGPVHDVLSKNFPIPSSAIRITSGDTIDSAVATVTLPPGNRVFEARLDGYGARFVDLRNADDMDEFRNLTRSFENAVTGFLSGEEPSNWKIGAASWLKIEGGTDVAEDIVRALTWLPEHEDPFEIGATKTVPEIKFVCYNAEQSWAATIVLEQSRLPGSDLFFQISGEYFPGSRFDDFEKKADHIYALMIEIAEKLHLQIG